jgi:hypothetical protein
MARQQPLPSLAESAGLREMTRNSSPWSIPNYLVIPVMLAGVALAIYFAYGLLEL